MGTISLLLHVLICILLMIVILMQSSKGGGLAGTFGGSGGGMGSLFGTRGTATFLTKVTTVLAILFMLSSIGQSLYSKSGKTESESLIRQQIQKQKQKSPAAQLPTIPGTQQGNKATEGKQEQIPQPDEEENKQ